jgi:hypothetical protein
MPLLSAIADFTERSLASLDTTWERLAFVADLRGADGVHRHWGMESVHGEKETAAALAVAHADLVEAVASSRFADLWQEAHDGAQRESCGAASFLARLNSPKALPADTAGVAVEHFQFVLTNLSRVARYRSQSSRLAA